MEKAIPADELALMKRWVETWKRVGPELERIKQEELRALTDEQGLKRALLVLDTEPPDKWIDPQRIVYSGLIEQQRIFAIASNASS